MVGLLFLPYELLSMILDCVGPDDLDNFVSSHKKIKEVAGERRLAKHEWCKRTLTTVVHFPGAPKPYGFPDLLNLVQCAPRAAEYIKTMLVRHSIVPADAPTVWPEWSQESAPDQLYKYYSSRARTIEQSVQETASIPSPEKEHWISEMKTGNEDPFVALLLLRLDSITRLVIVTRFLDDFFISRTLERIAKDHSSQSLSRLRTVQILCMTPSRYTMQYLNAFAALPSVVSLSAYNISETLGANGSLDPLAPRFEVARRSSSLQNLDFETCTLSGDTLYRLIGSAKSLRSFSYTNIHPWTRPYLTRVFETLHWLASTSLERLEIRCALFHPVILSPVELNFKVFRSLRVLTIDYGLLTSYQFSATDKIFRNLPPSLEILSLVKYQGQQFHWLLNLVKGAAKAKRKILPCLKEVRFDDAGALRNVFQDPIQELYVTAGRAGLTLTFAKGDKIIKWWLS